METAEINKAVAALRSIEPKLKSKEPKKWSTSNIMETGQILLGEHGEVFTNIDGAPTETIVRFEERKGDVKGVPFRKNLGHITRIGWS